MFTAVCLGAAAVVAFAWIKTRKKRKESTQFAR
jgi:hypothetical protein